VDAARELIREEMKKDMKERIAMIEQRERQKLGDE
jgi:hypothetical protein